MPDIQTALKAALSTTLREWDDDGEESPQTSSTINNSVSAPSQNIQGIPMTKHTFPIKNNISRTTFNYVRDNPGSKRTEIIIALEHLGYNKGSVSSLIAQMRKSNLIHSTDDLYYADVKEYTPIKSNYKPVASRKLKPALEVVKTKRKYTKRNVTGLGELLKAKLENPLMPNPSQDAMDAAAYAMGGHEPTTNKRFVSLVRNREPQDILKDMTVYQAHALYVHLKQMFGG
jgi:hypothetical protein